MNRCFSIVNGQVDALPGMLFGTTPSVFDASAPTGFDYTPFSGDGTTGSLHGLPTAVPEPTSLALLGVGALALFGRQWQRRGAS